MIILCRTINAMNEWVDTRKALARIFFSKSFFLSIFETKRQSEPNHRGIETPNLTRL